MTIIRKAQIIGALSGALLTLGILLGAGLPAGEGELSGYSSYLLWGVTQLPAYHVYRMVGLKWYIGNAQETSLGQLLLMLLLNSLLLALMGSIVGWLVKIWRGAKERL